MSSSTLDSNATPDGSTDPQKARPRRRRPARPSSAATTATTATTPAVEQATPPTPATAEAPTATTTAAATETTSPDEAGRARGAGAATGNGRNRRGRGRGEGRKSAIQLIVPPTHTLEGAPAGDESAEQPTAAEPAAVEASTAAEARVVPVTTEVTPAAPEAATTTQASAPVEAAPPRSRYRFSARTPVVPTTPLVRPEKLSNGATVTTAPAEAPQEAHTSPTDEAENDDWQATITEVAPADVERSAAEAQSQSAASDEHAVNDLISALGLHEQPTPRFEAVPEPRAEEESDASAEAETSAAEETSEAEGQNGTRRRRRRRRGSSHAAATDELDDDHALTDTFAARSSLADDEAEAERGARNGYEPYAPYGTLDQPYSPYTRAPRERAPQPSAWDVSASQQQSTNSYNPYGQSSQSSAYGSPAPSFARGFGPQSQGVAGPVREPLVRPARTERGTDASVSASQLAQIVSNAISQQTDRLLTELRHQQQPPSMTLQLPVFPSTERIGIFVDVANLFYSARSMRVALDFGRMLDFLRANRRLVRAQAYAPTNPDANADQSFLNAVKGMGYRITTKNYKTFSSGAKKADMDLDLCMDIVRIVDAGAVDTIVLVSGDSDFLPLLEYCSDHGVRVEVAAFDDSAAMILRQSCDLFINLSMVDEIRA